MSRTGNSYRDRNYNSGFFGSEGRGSGSRRVKGTQVVFEIMKQSTQKLTVVMGAYIQKRLKIVDLHNLDGLSIQYVKKKRKEAGEEGGGGRGEGEEEEGEEEEGGEGGRGRGGRSRGERGRGGDERGNACSSRIRYQKPRSRPLVASSEDAVVGSAARNRATTQLRKWLTPPATMALVLTGT